MTRYPTAARTAIIYKILKGYESLRIRASTTKISAPQSGPAPPSWLHPRHADNGHHIAHGNGIPGAPDTLLPVDGTVSGFGSPLLSVELAVGVVSLAVRAMHGPSVWCLGAFLSTTTYLLVLGIQFTVTDRQDCKLH